MRLFREARDASTAAVVGKTLLYSAAIWFLALALGPYIIHWLEARFSVPALGVPAHYGLGLAMLVLASIANLGIGATMAVHGRGTPLPMDTASELVIRGPYAFVRNPMAIAGLTQGLGVALMLDSLMTLNYVVLGGVIWNIFVRPLEESDMHERFGQPFADYESAVPCWIPRMTPYVADA